MRNLRGKTVVITGAASGIGRALAIKFAKKGANLALCDINQRELDRISWDVQVLGARVLRQVVDVSVLDQMENFKKDIMNQFGSVDVLINNAAVSLSETVIESQMENIQWVFSTNIFGVIHGCKVFLPELLMRKDAVIVNISSVFGLVGLPSQSAYCASKFAVKGYTESLRGELLGTPVKVILVHPGGVQTNIVSHGRHYFDAKNQKTNTLEVSKNFDSVAMTSPEQAAGVIIDAVRRPRFRVLIGQDARLIDFLVRFFPSSVSKIVAFIVALSLRKKAKSKHPSDGETKSSDVLDLLSADEADASSESEAVS